MLPNESTTRSELVTLPGDMEALVAAPGRREARPLAAFLQAQKLNVVIVHDADTAFEEALLHRPNVVLIDDEIPPAGGIELCQRIKNNSRTHFLPAILFASTENRQHRIRALAAGVDAIFHPGMDEQERRTRLWALLRSQAFYRRQERKHRAQGSRLRARGEWFGAFVHDIQNSIGALQANFEYLAQVASRGGASDPDVEECVRDSRMVFNQVVRGFRTVLDFERFESGRTRLHSAPVAMARIARETKDELEWQESRLGKPLALDVGAREIWVEGDADFLRQALMLLCGHLLRQPGNTRVTVAIDLAHSGMCRVLVAGDGPTIRPEEREWIFDPYARTPRRAPLGHGLGLALARMVIELHGGTVRVEDTAEGASAFVVELKSRDSSPKLPLRE
jgi:signal transduction histidine kinase